MSKMPPKRPYDIGYGKPPREKQFRPGQSGNPKGRPPKAKLQPKATNEIFIEQALVPVRMSTGDGKVTMISTIKAIFAQIFRKAATGDAKALRFLMDRFYLLDRAAEAAAPRIDYRAQVHAKLAVLRERLAAKVEREAAERAAGAKKPDDEISA